MGSRRRRGFTLLEVLAAVAILGIWYVVLATVGIHGLRAQGLNQRRLEASFLADEAVAGIASGLTDGAAPAEGVEEYEREDFSVRIEVEAFGLDVPPLDDGSTGSALPEGLDLPEELTTDLLSAGGPTGPGPLRRVRIEVSWPEGNDERSVIRETFAFDLQSVQSELAALEEGLAEALQLEERESRNNDQSDNDGADVEQLRDALQQGAAQ